MKKRASKHTKTVVIHIVAPAGKSAPRKKRAKKRTKRKAKRTVRRKRK